MYKVLAPQRTVRARASALYLHPKGPDRASEKMLREYVTDEAKALFPEGGKLLIGVQGMSMHDDGEWSIRAGAVGPPHHGEIFAPTVAEHNAWFMAFEVSKRRSDDDSGLPDPVSVAMSLWQSVFEHGAAISKAFFAKVV